ncbi:TPA: two-component system response regulator RstA [Escherichia coli]|nr:two-component system response regulator RstA [Escherichia coli]
MGKTQSLPILITGGGRRIGLALAWHFINQKQPVIVSYRTHYPAIDGLIKAGAQCIQADFSTNDGVMAFADEVLKSTHGLRAILHNASAWMAEKPGAPLTDVLACMMQIHVNTPYLLNHALERLLRGHGHAASDIIHFTDYVVMTICRDLRAKWSGPIVLLTSLDSDMNHILALEMGACDYILKTTPPAVLLARLRLHLRQNEQATVTKGIQETSLTPYKALHFGTLTIDPINRVVSLANTEISLSTADFELLWELATHAGQIMDRDALLKNLRGVSYDGLDRSVDVAISRLRKKLLDNAAEPYRIKTVRNKGYLFAPHAWE